VGLLVYDNQVSRSKTIRNAQTMIEAGVALAILFGADEDVSPALAGQFSSAAIPGVTIDQPISGAFYFGADNHGDGLALGQQMAIELSGTPLNEP
jgi:ABC-type sugar transport system substrate-binding protein